jgi:hypothetical protein
VAQGANAAKRRTDPVQGSQNQGGAVVNINLPVNSLMQFKMTSDRQVIEVDGRSMNTMQSAKVQELARAVKLAENTVPQVSEASRKLLESF